MTEPTTPSTGPKSTSFKVAATGVLSGLGIVIAGFLQNTNGVTTSSKLAVGGVLTLGSVVGKLFHDKGIHVATIQAAGSDVAQALPGLRQDISTVTGFVEGEWPSAKTALGDVAAKVANLEARVTAIPDVATIVAAVAAQFRSALTAPPATPAMPETPRSAP